MTYQLQTPPVTEREAEVLALLDRHMTNAQIAESLFISVRTVESHVSSMLRKLGVPDRRSLARFTATAEAATPGPLTCRSQGFERDRVGLGADPDVTDEIVHRTCCVAEVNTCAGDAAVGYTGRVRRVRHPRRRATRPLPAPAE
jgi:DNA-binding CsgD family transcriptional regulator